MVSAAGSSAMQRARSSDGSAGRGRLDGTPPKRLPMVSTGKPNSATAPEASTTATRKPGALGASLRSPTISPTQARASARAQPLKLSRCAHSTPSLGRNSAGTPSTCRPSRSLSWLAKMMTAMPAVKPVTSGCGRYFISVPTLSRPATTRITPAIRVAMTRPS